MNRTISIPANGSPVAVPVGPFKYLVIRSADVKFEISFDGGYWQPARQNDRYDKSESNPLPEKIYFQASGGLAAKVTIDYDLKPIGGQDTTQSSVTTSARGCGGSPIALEIPTALKVGGGLYVYNAGDYVSFASINKLPGVVNGKKRKTIYFDNRNSLNDLAIFDSAGGLWMRLAAGKDSPVFETSSDFYIGGLGNPSTDFIYCETFYENANS